MMAQELKALPSTSVGFAEIEDSDAIDTVVDDVPDLLKQPELLDRVEVADEHRILHRVTETLHGLMNTTQTATFANIVRDEVATTSHRVNGS